MDSNTIVSWSITILAIAALIIYFKMRTKKLEKKTFSVLQKFANENACEISSYDHWGKCFIGISHKDANRLLFIRSSNNNDFRTIINLSDVKNCRMNKFVRSVQVDGDRTSVIDKIEIVFTFTNGKKPDVQLEIYNSDYDQLTLWRELEISQKWTELVNSIISKNKILEHEYKRAIIIASNKLNVSKANSLVNSHISKKEEELEAAGI